MLMHTSFSWSCPHTDIICSPSSPSPIPTVSTCPQNWSFHVHITCVLSPSPSLPLELLFLHLMGSLIVWGEAQVVIDQQNMVLCIVYKIINTQSQEKRKVMRAERVCLWVHYVFILFSTCVCCCLCSSLSKINLAYIQLVSFLEEYSNTLNSTYFKFTYKQGQIYYQ